MTAADGSDNPLSMPIEVEGTSSGGVGSDVFAALVDAWLAGCCRAGGVGNVDDRLPTALPVLKIEGCIL